MPSAPLPDPHADDVALVAAALPGWSCSTGWRFGWGEVVLLVPPGGEGHQTLVPEGPAFRALVRLVREHAAYRAEVRRTVIAARAALVGPAP